MLRRRLPNHQIVDSAETTARVVASVLEAQLQVEGTANLRGQVKFLATDGVARFKRVGGFFLGESIDEVELIDL